MSTIKVTNIEHGSTGDGGIQLDSSGHVTIDGQQMPTDGPLSNRNLIYNGAMQVAVRSAAEVNSNMSTGGLTYQTLDRWGHWANSANLFSADQVADAPAGFYHSVKLKSLASTNMAAGGYVTWSQRFEAQDLYRTGMGTANAKDLTLSFWVKGSITGTYSFYAFNASWSYCFVSTYTINTATTWEYKTISIPGPTSNFTATGNARQLEIGFTLGSGTNYQTSTLNQWQSLSYMIGATNTVNLVSTANATLNLTGIQLEVGEKATPFEHRSYGDELVKCQRYFERIGGTKYAQIGTGMQRQTNQTYFSTSFKIQKRAAPTASYVGSIITSDRFSHDENVTALQDTNISVDGIHARFAHNAVGAQRQPAFITAAGGSPFGYMDFNAEL